MPLDDKLQNSSFQAIRDEINILRANTPQEEYSVLWKSMIRLNEMGPLQLKKELGEIEKAFLFVETKLNVKLDRCRATYLDRYKK